MGVSVMTAVSGVKMYGESVVEPHPIMISCLLTPAAILAILFIKIYTEKHNAMVVTLLSVVDIVTWVLFCSTVKKAAEDYNCRFKTTGWFLLNMVSLVLIVLLSGLIALNKLHMDTDLIEAVSGGEIIGALNQMSTSMRQMSKAVTHLSENMGNHSASRKGKHNTIGFCSKCGNTIELGDRFCTSCGYPVSHNTVTEEENSGMGSEETEIVSTEDAVVEETGNFERSILAEQSEFEQEDIRVNEERPMYCQNCGAKIGQEDRFCVSCGRKIL